MSIFIIPRFIAGQTGPGSHERRAAILARLWKEKPHILHKSDFLLGVYDLRRMDGLSFKLDADGEFLGNEHSFNGSAAFHINPSIRGSQPVD